MQNFLGIGIFFGDNFSGVSHWILSNYSDYVTMVCTAPGHLHKFIWSGSFFVIHTIVTKQEKFRRGWEIGVSWVTTTKLDGRLSWAKTPDQTSEADKHNFISISSIRKGGIKIIKLCSFISTIFYHTMARSVYGGQNFRCVSAFLMRTSCTL